MRGLYFEILSGFCVCGGFIGSDGPEITLQRGVGGVQNDVTIRAIPQVFLDLAFDRWRELSL
jgi:hypothetical protein